MHLLHGVPTHIRQTAFNALQRSNVAPPICVNQPRYIYIYNLNLDEHQAARRENSYTNLARDAVEVVNKKLLTPLTAPDVFVWTII